MPAIALNSQKQLFMDMPFIRLAQSADEMRDYQSDLSTKMRTEANAAIRRKFGTFGVDQGSFRMLDPFSANTRNEMRLYAAIGNVDFDALVAGASRHFVSSAITRRVTPLSKEELERLFEDDQRAFGW